MATRLVPPRVANGALQVALVLAILAACATPPGDRSARASSPAVVEIDPRPAGGPEQATTFAEAERTGRADLAFYFVPSSGFAYRDASGRLTGVTVELLRDFATFVAERREVEVHTRWIEEPRWADFYGYVRDSEGGVFGIGNVTITDARRDELSFSPPYLNNIAVLVTHSRVSELSSMDALGAEFSGLTALPYPGTLHEARLLEAGRRWMPEMTIRPVASNDELVSLLASDGGYFGYIDVYNYWRARQAGAPLRRHAVGDDGSETFGVIMPHGSDWAPLLEEFFRSGGGYIESDRFRGLLRDHLGDELAALLAG
jgi:hypothetical protein